VYVQNASLEIAWTRVVFEQRTIAGDVLVPFLTEGDEGFDINDEHDWMIAERLVAEGRAVLPRVAHEPFGVTAGGPTIAGGPEGPPLRTQPSDLVSPGSDVRRAGSSDPAETLNG
jgi:hypothetical protein